MRMSFLRISISVRIAQTSSAKIYDEKLFSIISKLCSCFIKFKVQIHYLFKKKQISKWATQGKNLQTWHCSTCICHYMTQSLQEMNCVLVNFDDCEPCKQVKEDFHHCHQSFPVVKNLSPLNVQVKLPHHACYHESRWKASGVHGSLYSLLMHISLALDQERLNLFWMDKH